MDFHYSEIPGNGFEINKRSVEIQAFSAIHLEPDFRKAFTNELLLVIIRSVIIHDSVKENIIPSHPIPSVSEESWVSHFQTPHSNDP